MAEDQEDFDTEILAVETEHQLAKQREMKFWYEKKLREKQRLERGELLEAQKAENPEQVATPPSVNPHSMPTAAIPEDEQEGVMFWASEIGSATFGGVRDAAQELVETGYDLAGSDSEAFQLPKINENETAVGQGVRSMVQLMTGFIPAIGVVGKGAKVARAASNALTKSNKADKVLDGAGGQTLKYAAAGALADGTVIDPHAERLADLFVEMEKRDPEAEKSIMEWLASDPNDTKAEGRLKNVIEGLALGGIADGVIKGIKALKGKYSPENIEELKDRAKSGKTIDELEAEFDAAAPDPNKVGPSPMPEVSPVGRETGELDANGKAIHYLDNADPDSIPDINKSIADGETPNLAPRKVDKDGKPIKYKYVKIKKTIKDAKGLKHSGVASLTKAIKEFNGDNPEVITDAFQKGGVNLNHVDDIDGLWETVEGLTKELSGTKAFKETETSADVLKLAKEMDMTPKAIKELHTGTADLGARVVALHSLNIVQYKEAMRLSTIAADLPSAANAVAANKALEVFGMLRATIRGTQKQIARGLAHQRLIKADSNSAAARRLGDLLESQGGAEANINKFKKIAALGKNLPPNELEDFIKKSTMGKINSVALELLINSMLSGPQTHVVNALSNFLVSVMGVAERSLVVGKNKAGLGAENNMTEVGNESLTGGALKVRTMGMFRGLNRAVGISALGIRAAREAAGRAATGDFKGAKSTIVEKQDEFGTVFHAAAKDESQLDPLGKHKTERGAHEVNAITAENAGITDEHWVGKAVNVLGSTVRVSGRALITADELFKSISYTGEMAEMAYSQTVREGFVPNSKEFAERMLAIEKNPDDFMKKQALKVAREDTFTNPLGETGRKFTNFVNDTPLARYILPFVRTPINILKYAGIRTPVVRLMAKSVRDDLAAGGARADLANARMNIASVAYLLGTLGAAEGNISGAGGGGNKKSQRANGWQAYSVKIGDTWYAYDRLDPLSIPLAISASFLEMGKSVSEKEAMERIADAMVGTLEFAGDKAWFSGVLEISAAISEGNSKKFQTIMKQYPNTFIPFSGARRALARSTDRFMREQYDYLDVMAANTPFISDLDQIKVDDFGEDREVTENLGPSWLTPIKVSKVGTDPTKKELADLDIQFAKVSRTIGKKKHTSGVELDEEQYRRFQQLIGKDAKIGGKGFKEALDDLIGSEYYKNLHDDDKAFAEKYGSLKEDRIRKLRSKYKKAAERQLKEEYPSLKQATLDDKYNTRFKLRGIPIPQWLLDAQAERPNK